MKSEICYTDPTKFCEAQLKLLHLEREAEIERTQDLLLATDSQNLCLKKSGELERKGLGFRKLIIQDWTTSSFGKNLLTFAKRIPDTDLPASSIQTGTHHLVILFSMFRPDVVHMFFKNQWYKRLFKF